MIFIAEEGWKFMIHYAINLSCAKWSHITKLKSKNLMLLEKISYEKGFFEYKPRKGQIRNIPEPMLVGYAYIILRLYYNTCYSQT